MKNNQIAVLIDRMNVGGVEKIAIEEVKALIKDGQDAQLVVLRRKGLIDNAFQDLRKGVPTIYLDDRLPGIFKITFKFPVFHFFSLFHITYPFLIPFVIKKKEFDYIIVHGTYTAFTAIGIKKFKKIPYAVFIWDPIGYILTRVYSKNLSVFIGAFIKLAKFLDKKIVSNSEIVLVGGDAHNKYINALNTKTKIRVISPSVHPSKNFSLKKKNYVLMVTAWKKGKNPEYIFDLVDQIPNVKIKMVGRWIEDQYEKEFKEKIKAKTHFSNIEIVGEVTEEQLSRYYSEASVLLQTNDDKGFGMPALEAAGHGTTFIIPKGQGVCGLFVDKRDGFYTKEKDTSSILNYLSLLLNDKDLMIKMSKSAWEKVNDNYSWGNHARDLLEVISAKK